MKNRKAVIALLIFISYFIYNNLQALPLVLLGIDYNNLSLTTKVIYLLLYELSYIIILFLVFKKTFIEKFKEFIKNFKPLVKKYMEYWALSFGLMILCNFIIVTFFPTSIATNQENIDMIFNKAPLYIIISAVLFAPFIEETIFRLSLRNIFNNDKLFIIISGLVFGALHVIGSFTSFADLIYIFVYSISGFVFAYTLVKSKNIFVPMSLHLFHNGFSMLLSIISTFLF